MKKSLLVLLLNLIIFSGVCFAQKKETTINKVGIQLNYALQEITKAKLKSPDLVSPRSIRADTLYMVPSKDWTSGFFPGCLWYMYELTNDTKWLQKAKEYTAPIEEEKTNGKTHDMGFKMYCSFGNGYRLTKDPNYRAILIASARTLTTRFNAKIGAIKSWDHHNEVWNFPVIIDNMMNLELLFWAFKETNDSLYYKVAVSHANTTMKNHFRPDFSSYHVVGYDVNTGKVIQKNTHQGFNDASAWARGQSWGLYSYTMCYRETGDKEYLKLAENIANFILKNKNLPKDLVPYWDFNDPAIPNAPRDASAGALMASAFYELSMFVPKKSKFYVEIANKIMNTLSTKYSSKPLTNEGFLLTSSTGDHSSMTEINTPIIYADYYYMEALVRQKNLK